MLLKQMAQRYGGINHDVVAIAVRIKTGLRIMQYHL